MSWILYFSLKLMFILIHLIKKKKKLYFPSNYLHRISKCFRKTEKRRIKQVHSLATILYYDWISLFLKKWSAYSLACYWQISKEVVRNSLPGRYLLDGIQDEDKEETSGRKEKIILCWPTMIGERCIFGRMHLYVQKKGLKTG